MPCAPDGVVAAIGIIGEASASVAEPLRHSPSEPIPDLEAFWAEVLSAEPERVRAAYGLLYVEQRREVRAHLHRMATEAGWTASQRERARAALAALADVGE